MLLLPRIMTNQIQLTELNALAGKFRTEFIRQWVHIGPPVVTTDERTIEERIGSLETEIRSLRAETQKLQCQLETAQRNAEGTCN